MKTRIIMAGLAIGLVCGCTKPEDKVKKILDARLSACKAAEGPFFEVELNEGTDEILTDACALEITDLKMTDRFHAMANTGPYAWLFGEDTETGVWALTQAKWETLEQARRNMSGDDAPVDALERAEGELAEAQKALPDSRWIRVTRAENALNIRTKRRGKDKQAPTTLGASQAAFEESLNWAKEKDKTALAQIQLAYLDHYSRYNRKLEMALENLGSQDDAYEASIRQAVKEKDEKTLKNYTEELEKMQAERPAIRAMLYERLGKIFDQRCATIGQMSADGVEIEEVKQNVIAAKNGMNCSPDARPKPEEQPEE